MGVFSGGSVGYLTSRQVDGTDEMPMLQVRACGFGPDGAYLTKLLTDRVRAWQEQTADGIDVTIQVRRATAARLPEEDDAVLVVAKTDNVFIVTATPSS